MTLLEFLYWVFEVCSDFFFRLFDLIGYPLDALYIKWMLSLIFPGLVIIFILPFMIFFMLYLSALILYIHSIRWSRVRVVLNESLADPWVCGRYIISLLWEFHGYLWFGYSVRGVENIPARGGALIVYYHGAIPIDVYYMVAHFIVKHGRHIHCVGDRFLHKVPGWKNVLEAFRISAATVPECVQTVSSGNLLALSPGGVREAQFSDHSYPILWGNRRGFAKVALQANVPIIPMFTRNLREAFRVITFPSFVFEYLYQKFKLPFAPLYGGFPVKLVTHLGPCIYPIQGETPEELAARVEGALYSLIEDHQRIPGNILGGLLERVHPKLGDLVIRRGVGRQRHAEEDVSAQETNGNLSRF